MKQAPAQQARKAPGHPGAFRAIIPRSDTSRMTLRGRRVKRPDPRRNSHTFPRLDLRDSSLSDTNPTSPKCLECPEAAARTSQTQPRTLNATSPKCPTGMTSPTAQRAQCARSAARIRLRYSSLAGASNAAVQCGQRVAPSLTTSRQNGHMGTAVNRMQFHNPAFASSSRRAALRGYLARSSSATSRTASLPPGRSSRYASSFVLRR